MVKTKLSQAKRSIPIHAFFIIIRDITFLVLNSQVTDKRVHIQNYFTIRQQKKKVKCFRTSKVLSLGRFFFGHTLFFLMILHLQQFSGIYWHVIFLNTWHRNNWMAIVYSHRKRVVHCVATCMKEAFVQCRFLESPSSHVMSFFFYHVSIMVKKDLHRSL